ncbi:transporter [Candidatus Shapirobacteria bacterium CG03_land_8_20_14_0_80_39_12]|uniref:Transporter n=1 Tax=Candidatus Shapirobacteria bacterium CG03_land_8_20_14_0_80_39_12 TaxID=1974879 RepID=A0A2M7BFB5_9BACT|nr:MAG: transporter [Candidatus Shapirobacteria bacterium CG03_land_8_20_14_0_80_39_12]
MEKNRLSVIIFFLGLVLVGLGVLGYKIFNFSSGPKVEILGETTEKTTSIIIKAEIAGEVIKPGVYDLKEGSRINELLTIAGGLSAKADRDWVAKNINLAQKLTDGGKIYIPKISQISNIKDQNQISNLKTNNLININSASEAELDTLWGVGPATAKNIIAGRPYQKIEELLEKKIVKSNVWEKIKDQVTTY